MSSLISKSFWFEATQLAVRSFAQALLVAGAFDQVGIISADWSTALSLAGGYALASLLTSVAASGFGDDSALFGNGH